MHEASQEVVHRYTLKAPQSLTVKLGGRNVLTSSMECCVDRREALFIGVLSEVRARTGSVIASLFSRLRPVTRTGSLGVPVLHHCRPHHTVLFPTTHWPSSACSPSGICWKSRSTKGGNGYYCPSRMYVLLALFRCGL